MTHNRALEFLYGAQDAFPILHDRWGWKSKHFVELAIAEVEELLDRLALYEATDAESERRIETRAQGVLVMDAQPLPARLVKQPRAALPKGNGDGWKQL